GHKYMTFLNELLDIALYLALIGLAIAPLEKAFCIRSQPFFRREWFTDLLFFLGGNLLWTKLTIFILSGVRQWSDSTGFLIGSIESWPLVAQIICVVFLSDFLIYWAHRFSHRNAFLWRFHKIHHTAETLDWLAAFREHPIDNMYTR